MSQTGEFTTVTLAEKMVIRGADKHPHAANRLAEAFPDIEWISADTSPSSQAGTLSLEASSTLPEGGFHIHPGEKAEDTVISGGPFSGVIYGVEELIQRKPLSRTGGSITLPSGSRTPDLAYRTFWTWDHSTNWYLDQIGQQEIGVFNSYGKPPSGFLQDYKRVVDFCSMNRIGGVVVYGFLRDSHEGVAAAQELCRYANARGVRIIPGIAIGAYGGIYWEGAHRFNLSTWLKDNPGTEAVAEGTIGFQIDDLDFPLSFPRSDYTKVACPSDPATMDWMEDAVSWLSETFDIGGVNIESGDYGVCGCDRCVARRGDRDDPAKRQELLESWSHADLTDNFPRLFDAIIRNRPDAWVYCELQWDNLLDNEGKRAFDAMPDGAIYQHTVNRTYWNRVREELPPGSVESFPTSKNALRTHIASQWSGDARTERYFNNSSDVMQLARQSATLGFNGLTIWGEASPHHVPTELGYLAFSRFGFDSTMEWDQFHRDTVAPLFGGIAEANEFLQILEDADKNLFPEPAEMARLRGRIRDGIAQAGSDEVFDRWSWLANHVSRRYQMAVSSPDTA